MALLKAIVHYEDIRLVDFDQEHISERYLSWMKDDEVTKYLEKPSKDLTSQDLKDYASSLQSSPDNYFFAIIHTPSQTHIGNLRIGPITWDKSVSLFGIMIGDKSFHGQGLGLQAMKCTLEIVFNHLKLNTFRLGVTHNNEAAISLYKKIGMIHVETVPDAFNKNGSKADMLYFEINNPNQKSSI